MVCAFITSAEYQLRFSPVTTRSNVDCGNKGPTGNHPPSVSTGAAQTITLPNSANLSGTVTDDGLPAGGTPTVSWSKVSGPGTVTFGTPNSVTTTASFSAAGVYVLRLTASDSQLFNSSDVTITVNSGQPVITSLSSSSPLPLTALYIQTAGINANAPVSMTFSNSSGFSVTTDAIRVKQDGTVVASVPLYLDQSSHQIGPGTVSLVLKQGSQTTAPVTINIQDLPSINSYGTKLGEITHAVLVRSTILIGNRINQLQAFQHLPGNTLSTAQALSTLQAELKATIAARSDVDRVMADNSVVIDGGTLPRGTHVTFDKNTLEMMDRVNAIFLTQTLKSSSQGSSPAQTFGQKPESISISSS